MINKMVMDSAKKKKRHFHSMDWLEESLWLCSTQLDRWKFDDTQILSNHHKLHKINYEEFEKRIWIPKEV